MTHLDEMIEALGLEVEAIRKGGDGARLDLRDGELIDQTGGNWLYQFTVPDAPFSLRDDTPIRIEVDGREVQGTVVSFRDGVLAVALEENLGLTIPWARLIWDPSFLVKRLKERLEEVRKGAAYFNGDAANRTLGLHKPRLADANPHHSVLADGSLNGEQIDAVWRALGSDTTFVWGPPGTGKTTTLARIVEGHYRAGRSVLLVSNTNIAVDTALEQVAERLSSELGFDEGLVLRKGTIVKEELKEKFGAQVVVEGIVRRLGEPLQKEKDHLLAALEPLKSEEEKQHTSCDTRKLYCEALQCLRRHKESLRKAKDKATNSQTKVKRLHQRASEFREEEQRALTMGAMRRFLTRVDPERLARQAAIAEGDARAAAVIASTVGERIRELETETPALGAEAARLSRITHIDQRICEIERKLAGLEQRILARCRILATTAYKAYLEKSPRQFDVVVIDEASMLMPPLVYFAAGLATESVTVAGDFRQLSPIVMSDGTLAERWLKPNVFEIADIPARVDRGEPPPELMSLAKQYRMREPICAVVSDLFYDGRLVTARGDAPGKPDLPFGPTALLYVDTAELKPWAGLRKSTWSRYNPLHAHLVRNIVKHLADKGYVPPEGINESIGVVSPYRAQADLIHALLDERLGPRAAGIAATVHRFQGNEKRTMIIDLTESPDVYAGRFVRASGLDGDGARLLNVALSRAKDHIVLVGNFDYLRASLEFDALLLQIVDRFRRHGQSIDAESLLAPAGQDWFDDQAFYAAFKRDVDCAEKSIVVFSPSMTGRGTGYWVDHVRDARKRGVEVHVHTRPPECTMRELIDAYRRIGVKVSYRQEKHRKHEKTAIIDGHVLWYGSLNILSDRNARGSMLRIVSPAFCQQLLRNLGA